MFTRFVRLGVPAVQLDAQGRARPSLCQLYQWRYDNLGNLPHVLKSPEYQMANAGFLYEYQLINVEDYNGTGESQPNPYFYQVVIPVCACMYVFMCVCVCVCVCVRVRACVCVCVESAEKHLYASTYAYIHCSCKIFV